MTPILKDNFNLCAEDLIKQYSVQLKKVEASKSKMNIQTEKRHSPAPSPMVPVRDLEVQSFPPWGPDPVPLTEPS